MAETADRVLKEYFGYDSFRPGQKSMVDAILSGKDVLAVMPTGAGKSICYQVPALILEGITLVISPLISLMVDQVRALNTAGIHAAYINSALTDGQIALALRYAAQGRYRLIYVAPERLFTPEFMTFAMTSPISMLAVDEAHCISQWGQDFRPSYLRIWDFAKSLPSRPVIAAFTATATQRVQEDIVQRLKLQEPKRLVTGFDRPNLYFALGQPSNKMAWIAEELQKSPKDSVIIYCSTRKKVEEVAEALSEEGLAVGMYHGGMDAEERSKSQEAFIRDQTRIMVATNAFGMGIDKPDVRRVIHYNMPQSMENYYQEAGRAGRDGEPAEAILLTSSQDYVIARYLLSHKEYPEGMSQREIMEAQDQDELRLRAMIRYSKSKNCLRKEILRYFGESPSGDCGNCSSCCKIRYENRDPKLLRRFAAYAGPEKRRKSPSFATMDWDQLTREAFDSDQEDSWEQGLGSGRSWGERRSYGKRDASWQDALAVSRAIASKGAELDPVDQDLLDQLDHLRQEIAQENGVPPYMICNLRTLKEICRQKPKERSQMLRIPGMTEAKYENFGWRFLRLLEESIE